MALKELSQRQLRVGQEIKRIIAEEINQGRVRNLEPIDTLVTIMETTVSPDLKYADVYFVTTNGELDEKVREALQLAANHFRKVVATRAVRRGVGGGRGWMDNTMAEADKIEKLLHDPKVQEDLKKQDEA